VLITGCHPQSSRGALLLTFTGKPRLASLSRVPLNQVVLDQSAVQTDKAAQAVLSQYGLGTQ
jgi:hypothetical protein